MVIETVRMSMKGAIMKKLFLFIPGLIMILLIMNGCGTTSGSELKALIPEEITQYNLNYDNINYEYFTQDVTDIKVLSRSENGSLEDVQCEISLKDENLERTVFANLRLMHTNGNVTLDSWSLYHDDEFRPLIGPDEKDFSNLDSLGYKNLTIEKEDSSQIKDGKYFREYQVDDQYEYVSFTGTIIAEGTFKQYQDEDEYGCAGFSWSIQINDDDIVPEWNVFGAWVGESEYNTDDHPNKFEVDIESLEGENIVVMNGTVYSRSVDGDEFLRYAETKITSGKYKTDRNYPSSAKLTISFDDFSFEFTIEGMKFYHFGWDSYSVMKG